MSQGYCALTLQDFSLQGTEDCYRKPQPIKMQSCGAQSPGTHLQNTPIPEVHWVRGRQKDWRAEDSGRLFLLVTSQALSMKDHQWQSKLGAGWGGHQPTCHTTGDRGKPMRTKDYRQPYQARSWEVISKEELTNLLSSAKWSILKTYVLSSIIWTQQVLFI